MQHRLACGNSVLSSSRHRHRNVGSAPKDATHNLYNSDTTRGTHTHSSGLYYGGADCYNPDLRHRIGNKATFSREEKGTPLFFIIASRRATPTSAQIIRTSGVPFSCPVRRRPRHQREGSISADIQLALARIEVHVVLGRA